MIESSRARVIAGFAAVYVLWGSTYLAMSWAIETIPPFYMAALRFLIAGAVLYAWARARGDAPPTRTHWRSAAVVGALLLVTGNGLVVWAEQRVPSGLASLLVATMPLWMVLLDWMRPAGRRPTPATIAGIALGLAGLGVLVGPGTMLGHGGIDPLGAGVLVAASLSWAAGSLYSRRAPLPRSPFLGTAMEMLAGGAMLVVVAIAVGERAPVDPRAISLRSAASLGYLVVFGSLVGFTTYLWLLRVASPARVSTYAFVNPVVAVFLGWALASEPITPRTMVAAAVIVGAVALITTGQGRRPARREGPRERRRERLPDEMRRGEGSSDERPHAPAGVKRSA